MIRTPAIRRLLVISYHYPPDGAVGGMRWEGMSRYLAGLGWEIHVVTGSSAAADTSIPGVHPTVRRRLRTLNDWYNATADRFKSARDPGPQQIGGDDVRPSSLRQVASALRRAGGTWLMFPDYARGWIFRAAMAARAQLRAHEFDAVITSGPPHSVHLAGVLATMGRREPLWIDMRDPWSPVVTKSLDPQDPAIIRFLIPRLERFVFRRARKVIVNTAEFAATLRLAEPQLSVSYIPNGIDLAQLPQRTAARYEGCSIAYVGTLYAGRSLSSVLAAMRGLLRDEPVATANLRLRIAGSMAPAHKQELLADLAKGDLTNLVNLFGLTPRAQALDLLVRSHLALVLAQDQQTQVPAKLYECVGLGIPTLVIAEHDSAAAREARRIGAMSVDVDDVDGIRAVLADTLFGRLPDTVVPKTSISYEDLALDVDRLLRDELDRTPSADKRPGVPVHVTASQGAGKVG